MPDIANLNIPVAAANDAPSRAAKHDKSPVSSRADGLSSDADASSPSFKSSLEEAQTQAAAQHESDKAETPQQQGGNTLPEAAASSGKQGEGELTEGEGSPMADNPQTVAPATEITALQPAVTAVDKVMAQADAINTQSPVSDNLEHPFTDAAQVLPGDAGLRDTVALQTATTETQQPTDTDAGEDAVAILPAGVSNGLAQQALKNVATDVDETMNNVTPPSAASQLHVDKPGQSAAATQTQAAMHPVTAEHAKVKAGAESDVLFKLSMQAIADAPASGLQGGALQSTATLSSVNTMQALLQPDAALRGDNPSLSATVANTLTGGRGPGQGLTQTSTVAGGLASGWIHGDIATPFGKPEWGQALGKQVMMMVNQNVRSAEIRMNPAHLGPIEIQIDMQDEQVNVAFSSRHAVVREAMEQAMPRLREMLDSNGLSLAESNVSDHSFAEQREFAFTGNKQGGDSHASGFASPIADDLPADVAAPVNMQALSSAMLDVYI